MRVISWNSTACVVCFAGKVYITPCEWLSRCREAILFFTVSEDDVVLADKFCERSYNDKIHLVIAIDFTATRQIIRQLHDSLISFDRAI